MKRPPARRPSLFSWRALLLDLVLFVQHVLARNRIVLLEFQLLRRRARILPRHVVVTGIGRAHELDHNGRLLGHGAPHPAPGVRGAANIQRWSRLSSRAEDPRRRSIPAAT